MKDLEWSFERFYTPKAREDANICLNCTRPTCGGYCNTFRGPHGEGDDNMKGYFRALDVTQEEVARVLGISRTYLSRYIRSRLSDEAIQRIKDAATEAARRKNGKL